MIYREGLLHPDARTLDDLEPLNPKYSRFLLGGWASDEVKARFLYLNAVLDRGSDMVGTREFLRRVTNELYGMGISFLHHPERFLSNTYVAEQVIARAHEHVKKARQAWAEEFLDNPDTYNLMLVFGERVTQILSHILVSWGLPLAIIQKAIAKHGSLLQMLDSYRTAERMAEAIKSDREYGLGKAIGDKACHLLCKWLVDEQALLPLSADRPGWSKASYEVPVDSNVGRVLVMSGVAAAYCGEDQLEREGVIQREDGSVYIRATNLRKCRVVGTEPLGDTDCLQAVQRLFGSRQIKSITLPRFLNAAIEEISIELSTEARVAHLDDGLLRIALTWCRNGDYRCSAGCPLRQACWAANENPEALKTYHT